MLSLLKTKKKAMQTGIGWICVLSKRFRKLYSLHACILASTAVLEQTRQIFGRQGYIV
jgi:hypothetical protein